MEYQIVEKTSHDAGFSPWYHGRMGRFALATVVSFTLGACLTNQEADPTAGLEFRSDRFAQMERLNTFDLCRSDAMTLDSKARARGDTAAYLTSAKVMEDCVDNLGDAAELVPQEDRMRLSAMATVNYFRGGDVEKARQSFETFDRRYPDADLYFADGSSFTSSVEALLGRTETMQYGVFSTLNVNGTLKRELRRMHHWKNQ